MNPVRIALVTAASSANNIALSQTPVSGTPLTLNGSTVTGGVATLDVPRRVLLTFGIEVANRTLVVTGTDRYGNVQSETLAVASGSASTVGTLRDFLTVTSALPLGGGWSVAATLGTSAIVSTPWVMREWGQLGKMGILLSIPASGPTCALECTFDDPNAVQELTPFGASFEPQSAVPPLAIVAPASETIFNPTTGVALTTQAWTAIGTPGAAATFDVPCIAIRMTQLTSSGTSVLYVNETTSDRKTAF